MTTSRTTPPGSTSAPTPTTPDLSAATIADLGAGVTRLAVALVPLSLRVVDTLSANLPRIVSQMIAAADASGATERSSEPGRTADDLVGATARLLKAAAHELNTALSAADPSAPEAKQSQRR